VSQYRDPLAGLRSQVTTKRAAAIDRAHELPPIIRVLLPEHLQEALADLGVRTAGAPPPPEDLDGLTREEAALDDLLAACDEAIALAPKLRELPDEVRDFPRPSLPAPWLLEEAPLLRFRQSLADRVKAITDDAGWLARWGDFGYIARLRLESAPIVFQATAGDSPADRPAIGSFVSVLRTSIPAGVPRLELRRERAHHTVSRALHLAHEVNVGDPAFDEAFWIAGAEATATLLVPPVRHALLALVAHRPVLVVDDGVVDLVWTGAWRHVAEDVLPDAAIAVVLGVRRAIAA
jgi:hypothetical protein